MVDWLEKISDLISSSEGNANNTVTKEPVLISPFLSTKKSAVRSDPTFANQQERNEKKPPPPSPPNNHPLGNKSQEKTMTDNSEENLKALKRLRELPRGTQEDSRIAAIKDLLGEKEVFKTLKMLRWPQGVLCPRCHSSNVVRRDPPADAIDQCHYYVCLDCKGEGAPSDFDDFTGLPIGSLHDLRQCILCWYLIGFCSISHIAKILGLSVAAVLQLAKLGDELTQLPEEQAALKAHKALEIKEKKTKDQRIRNELEQQEESTKSYSRSPTKPGPKSKL